MLITWHQLVCQAGPQQANFLIARRTLPSVCLYVSLHIEATIVTKYYKHVHTC